MPWRVFAILGVNYLWQTVGKQVALEATKMSSVASILAPKWGDSVFELFCCHLETHFEVIQEKTAHVDPSTPCYCVKSMLYLSAVSGLVVSRMEAILENGCLDIVAFLPFLERDGFNLPANLSLVHLLFGEVSPSLLSVSTFDWYLPSGMLRRYRPFARHCQ